MEKLLQIIKTWSPILVPLLTLLAGTGWLRYYLDRRREAQEPFKTILQDFLIPLEGALNTTAKIVAGLQYSLEYYNLDLHNSYESVSFERLLASFLDRDFPKRLWVAHIKLLQNENRRITELIQRFYGRIILEEFKSACDQFLVHAKEWELTLNVVLGSVPAPCTFDTPARFYAPFFPAGIGEALKREISEVKRRGRR